MTFIAGFPGAKPKEGKRGPKAKRPIARGKRPNQVSKSAARAAEVLADRKWSAAVKAKGACFAIGAWNIGRTEQGSQYVLTHRKCAGPIDPAHIMPRTWAATRHLIENGFPLCRETHRWFGSHPVEWESFVEARIGIAGYAALRAKALAGPRA